MKPVPSTPALPNAGRARDIQSVNTFDQDLTKAIFNLYVDLARRLNAALPMDGSEPMSGPLDMGGNGISNVSRIDIEGIQPILTLTDTNTGAESSFNANSSNGNAFLSVDVGSVGTDPYLNVVVQLVESLRFYQDRLVLLSGRLAFPATQIPSTDTHTLDDYEEGTWTPVLTFSTPGDLSVAYSTQNGRYVKIGKKVTVWTRMVTTTFTHTTASGEFRITGLPFAGVTSTGIEQGGTADIQGFTYDAGRTQISANMVSAANYIRFAQSGSGATRAVLDATNHTTGTAAVVVVSLTYEAAT